MTNESPGRPLPLLRAMIDVLDHELLQLTGRRMHLVAEIAEYKRRHGLRIRDPQREREVLDDRCRVADEMGLPRAEVEAIFRLLLRASREYQSALRAELPYGTEARTIAVIGGHGGMGSVMARLFSDLGHQVMIADLDTELSITEAAAVADVVIVSVPIAVTEDVIRTVGPHVREESLLMDVTSLKEGPVAAMLVSTGASVVGAHPMFGPSVHSLQGQRVVLCPARGERWTSWLKSMLEARGLVTVETTPTHHDRMMAVVQVLTHFQTQVLGVTLARLGTPLDETLRFTSPAYLLELFVTARHFGQSPELYGALEMRNPMTGAVTSAFQDTAREVAEILRSGDQERFDRLFETAQGVLRPADTREALEQTSFLIDRLVERQ